MKYFKFLAHTSAVLVALRLRGADANGDVGEAAKNMTTYTGTATKVDCLPAFNEARAAAGLVPFTQGSSSFWSTNKTEVGELICPSIIEEKPNENSTSFTSTVALAIQGGGTGDCAAAVTHFNGALAKFGSLPPAFNKDLDVYKSLQAVSFVALYNPQDNPTLECGYFQCTKNVTEVKTKDQTGTLLELINKNGLVCASSPLALTAGKEPFEQKQFDKIKKAINSASAAAPAFITLAVAAAGLILL